MKRQNQLCRQIKEALTLALPVDLALDIIDVIPGKSSNHYIVIFQPMDSNYNFNVGYDQLREYREEFIDEIASAINRRKVPDITFKISPVIDWDALKDGN